MIERYADPKIDQIWSNENKLGLWQETELAVIAAREHLNKIPVDTFDRIQKILQNTPIDVEWWLMKDKEIHHDLNAFVLERRRHLPDELKIYFHQGMTSYDTEEPAFLSMLKASVLLVYEEVNGLDDILTGLAKKYRFTPMNARTHGQEAEMQSFGKRCLTWYRDLAVSFDELQKSNMQLKYTKLSGAIGGYGEISPELEKEALEILGFKPYYGATQIMPRAFFVPVASALCHFVQVINKIAIDIRLGARSGRPLYHEPFKKKQTGSSAMPHKKNTIRTEQLAGMAELVKGYYSSILGTIPTWEERAIEQSCVERVAWPDLFHVTLRSIKVLTTVLKGLVVYPDNMLREIIESKGCYASNQVKEFLAKKFLKFGLTSEDAYKIVQLASFNVFEPDDWKKNLRENPPKEIEGADKILEYQKNQQIFPENSIKDIIPDGELKVSDRLDISNEKINEWNGILPKIFDGEKVYIKWELLFKPSYLLRNEEKLFTEILNE